MKGANSEGVWTVDAKNGNGSVKFGGPAKGDVTLMLADQDLVDLMTGKLNPQTAFFQGKLKIKGNMGLAMKLKEIKPPEGGIPKKADTDSAPGAGSGFKCAPVFGQIKTALEQDGANIVKKMKGIFCFRVKGKDGKEGIWVVDAKNGNGSVSFGGPAKGDVTILMNDDDMLNLMTGKLNPQTAFFQGKLKIQGNMGLAMKLKEIQPQGQSKL